VDTGYEVTLVPRELVKRFKGLEMKPAIRQVWDANNTSISIDGEIQLPFFLDERCLWTNALVSKYVQEVMLGSDWLARYGCIWDFMTGNLCIDGQPAVILTRRGHIKCRRVLSQEYLKIPPRSQKEVLARVTLLLTQDLKENVVVETNRLKPGFYVGRTLLPSNHRDVKVCVANTTTKPRMIAAGSYILDKLSQ